MTTLALVFRRTSSINLPIMKDFPDPDCARTAQCFAKLGASRLTGVFVSRSNAKSIATMISIDWITVLSIGEYKS
jgi:hypothetical protein